MLGTLGRVIASGLEERRQPPAGKGDSPGRRAHRTGALDALRQEGKIRHIGLDTLTADQLERALSLTGIASVQNRFNLLDRGSDAVLKVCETHGLGFLPWFPLANGALTGDAAVALDGVAQGHGATRGQIALAWLLHRSPVLCPTPGTGSPAHLAENLGAREIRLTTEDMSRLEALAPA